MNDAGKLRAVLAQSGVAVTDAQQEKLTAYVTLLLEWNTRVNLISRKDVGDVWRNHVLHSLAALALLRLPAAGSYIDIGTGGGLPGIPLAIMLPEASFLLADSVGKKIAAVEDMARRLELVSVRTANARVEDLAKDPAHRGVHDFCLARAVTRLDDLATWAHPLLRAGGDRVLVTWKGGDLSQEIALVRRAAYVKHVEEIPMALPGEEYFLREEKKLVCVEFRR